MSKRQHPGWDDWMQHPCGCQMGTVVNAQGENVFMFEPCHPDCELYEYVKQEAARTAKPLYEIEKR